jgi:hypothetical protein
LSANFEKLIGARDPLEGRYPLLQAGLLTPGRTYWWHVRARTDRGVWGPWSKTWHFVPGGPVPPGSLRLEAVPGTDGRLVLRWEAGGTGRKPVKYRVYGSDEKGFTVNDEPYRRIVGRSREVPAQVPANFVGEVEKTELVVLGTGVKLPNANRAFYRVVAIDDRGKRSGPSDYTAAPRPFLVGQPTETARVGAEYRGRLATVRSLGDLRLRTMNGKEEADFWDIEKARFVLTRGPSWLRLDEKTGVLGGVPDVAGTAEVVITVTLERSVRRPDEGRLAWGHDQVVEVVEEKVGSATQRFRIEVAP